jgi:hypothetical protein
MTKGSDDRIVLQVPAWQAELANVRFGSQAAIGPTGTNVLLWRKADIQRIDAGAISEITA